jgi:hypothetical protein
MDRLKEMLSKCLCGMKRKAHGAQKPRLQRYVEVASTAQRSDSPAQTFNQHFQKKEWRETRIPQEIRLRARNRAWEKIHRPAFRNRNTMLAFASCAVALAVIFVVFRSGPDVPVGSDQWSVVSTQDDVPDVEPHVSHTPVEATLAVAPGTNNAPASPAKQEEPAFDSDATDLPGITEFAFNETVSVEEKIEAKDEPEQRVVLNFILPESGARLIWIVSSNL